MDCFRTLLTEGANAKCMDEFGNTILHLAAMNSNNKLIDYISKNVKIDMFSRNKAGETALGICQNLKNKEGAKTLE